MRSVKVFVSSFILLMAGLPLLVSLIATSAQSSLGVVLQTHRVSVNIREQLAVTTVQQVFVNSADVPAEGVYLFPLPDEAAVSDLVLYLDGQAIKGQLLEADQARRIYEEIVRQRRDPVLLQYVGRRAVQLNIFPIPPRSQRKVEITYSHILRAENGTLRYTYPLKTDYVSALPVRDVSVSLQAESSAPIATVYSPNTQVSIERLDERRFRASLELSNYRAREDFSVFYGYREAEVSAALLTYRASALEDGFFMLVLTPPLRIERERSIPKDVLIVLDQSGSMSGEKWKQAQAAARFVLNALMPQDRFNVIAFSSGYRVFARKLQPASAAQEAITWVNSLEALGSTNINAALLEAARQADPERNTFILFLTDGLPTEGVTDPNQIVANFGAAAPRNVRLFAFGVGYDVDTVLLDTLSSTYGGTSVYVRPNEDVEAAVSALYSKVSAPVLVKPTLETDGDVILEDTYPAMPLPDLFAGSQLIVTGRYRGAGTVTLTLRGDVNGKAQRFTYTGLRFPENAGGEAFVARLWATRKIGTLLNLIRLRGENRELVESVRQLSVRYGIITPYTSYLIQEDNPSRGDAPSAPTLHSSQPITGALRSGEQAVATAVAISGMSGAEFGIPTPIAVDSLGGERIIQVRDRSFVLRNGVWTDTQYTSADIPRVRVTFLSAEYFALLDKHPELREYFALGVRVLVVLNGVAYEVTD
ncbi:MAG: VIT domain-containing protein [Anaerolineae bacterium]|nr:VIT domain-containing protein [Anaerolineae bacterium]